MDFNIFLFPRLLTNKEEYISNLSFLRQTGVQQQMMAIEEPANQIEIGIYEVGTSTSVKNRAAEYNQKNREIRAAEATENAARQQAKANIKAEDSTTLTDAEKRIVQFMFDTGIRTSDDLKAVSTLKQNDSAFQAKIEQLQKDLKADGKYHKSIDCNVGNGTINGLDQFYNENVYVIKPHLDILKERDELIRSGKLPSPSTPLIGGNQVIEKD